MSIYTLSFSNKCILLRQVYNLSTTELAHCLGFDYNSTISQFEKGKNMPSYETFINFSNFFGVSLDWLAGRSELIYTKGSVTEAEKALFAQIDDDFIAGEEVGEIYRGAFLNELERLSGAWLRGIPKTIYSKESLRSRYYSLPVRANIAVLLHMVPLGDLYWAEEYVANEGNKRGVLAGVKSRLHGIQLPRLADEYKEPGKKAKERAVNVVKLLRPKYTYKSQASFDYDGISTMERPIYDVEAAYTELSRSREGKEG